MRRIVILFMFFALNGYAQNTLWYEDFSTYGNGVTTGTDSRWTTSCTGCNTSNANDYFEVIGNAFAGRDMDGTGVWVTEAISISAYSNVSISVALKNLGNPDTDDTIRVSYSTNGSNYTTLSNGEFWDDISGTQTATASGISGTNLYVKVEIVTNANKDIYEFDNVEVTGTLSTRAGPGNCVDLDDAGGSNGDYLLLPDYFPSLVDSTFTIAAWINSDNVGKQGQRIFCYDETNSSAGFSLSLGDGGSGRLRFYIRGASGGSGVILDVSNSDYYLSSNTWYHVAIVHTTAGNNTRTIYVNGVSVASDTYTSNPTGKSGRAAIGGETNSGETANRFDGQIDEVSIWNTNLSQTEIRDLMCKRLNGNESNLLAYYRLDETGGSIASDATGKYPAELTNMDPSTDWVTSGAAVGNTSTYGYHSGSWTGQVLTHTSPDSDSIQVSSVSGNPECVHIYNVSEAPTVTSGISGLGQNDNYYGVFHGFGSSTSYTATLFYGENDGFQATGVADETDMKVYTRSNNSSASWSVGTATLDQTANTLTLTAVSTEFILGNTQSPLPIELIRFEGKANKTYNSLIWETGLEINSSHFELQRYSDEGFWISIATIDAHGTTNQVQQYEFDDYEIEPGVTFYRLLEVDIQGNQDFSDVLDIERDSELTTGASDIRVYPNPVANNSTVNVVSNQSLLGYEYAELLTVNGSRLQVVPLYFKAGAQKVTLPLEMSLSKGNYLLRLTGSEQEPQVFRLIVE